MFAVSLSLLRFYRIIVFTPAEMPEIKKKLLFSEKIFFSRQYFFPDALIKCSCEMWKLNGNLKLCQ